MQSNAKYILTKEKMGSIWLFSVPQSDVNATNRLGGLKSNLVKSPQLKNDMLTFGVNCFSSLGTSSLTNKYSTGTSLMRRFTPFGKSLLDSSCKNNVSGPMASVLVVKYYLP